MISKALLARYRQNIATPEELAELDRYFRESDHTELESFLNEQWETIGEEEAVDIEAKRRVWDRLEASTQTPPNPVTEIIPATHWYQSSSLRRWTTGVAASLILVALAVSLWKPEANEVAKIDYIERVNTGSEPLRVALSDGSVVWLSARSKVGYKTKFAQPFREIDLDGEAYFEIARDTLHPFLVHTNTLLVKVLGTSFTVNSFSQQRAASVSVRSGKVSVSVPGQASDVILLPNERVSYSGSENMVKALVESPVIVHPEVVEKQFEFTATPISEVFQMLEKAYLVDIRFDKKLLDNCTLSAKLTDQSLFTKLDMICASMGGSYVVNGTEIMITAPGCLDD